MWTHAPLVIRLELFPLQLVSSPKMRSPAFQSTTIAPFAETAPALIGIGIVLLMASAWWPAIPAVTAMAMVTFGATVATITRSSGTATLRCIVTLHLLIYMSLYSLFVGAVCHAAMTGPQNGLTFLQGVDFGVSAMLMSLVVRMSIAAMAEGGDAPAR